MGLLDTPDNDAPMGHIDVFEPSSIAGWALGTADRPAIITIVKDDLVIAEAIADRFRADLERIGTRQGHYAFHIPLPPQLDLHAIQCLVDGRPLALPEIAGEADAFSRRAAEFAPFALHAPLELKGSSPLPIKRVLGIGSCQLQHLISMTPYVWPNVRFDLTLIGHGGNLPSVPPAPLSEVDAMLIQIPLRVILPEKFTMQAMLTDEAYKEIEIYALNMLRYCYENVVKWSRDSGLPTFFLNFIKPPLNASGRLLSRTARAGAGFLFTCLNAEMDALVDREQNAYIIDIDGLSAFYGKRYISDALYSTFSHGSFIDDYGHDADLDRIEPAPSATNRFDAVSEKFCYAIWRELEAGLTTLGGFDPVKLIVTDLDNTLWRGVAADTNDLSQTMVEGWPLGYAEALAIAKSRGILLAIISKNDDEVIRRLWPQIFGDRLRLEDFLSVRIDWNDKPSNMARILNETNLLSQNVLFIDDSPAERAKMLTQYPDIRVLGADPLMLRQVVLYAPEVQVARINEESARRAETIQARIRRRAHIDRAPPSQLDLRVSVEIRLVSAVDDKANERVIELVNKTNQFNTTGKKTNQASIARLIQGDGKICVISAADSFANYGIIGAALISGHEVSQFAMSCRVFGLGVEDAFLGWLHDTVGNNFLIAFNDTGKNQPAWTRLTDLGLVLDDGFFRPSLDREVVVPSHVQIVEVDAA